MFEDNSVFFTCVALGLQGEEDGRGEGVRKKGGGRERGRFFYRCGYKKVYFSKIV